MRLMRATYMSKPVLGALTPTFKQACESLAQQSNTSNLRHNLTGALIVSRDWFVQTVEGERDSLMPVFLKILTDPRHSDVRIFEMTASANRLFPNWAMHVGDMNVIEPAIVWECVEGYKRHTPNHARTLVHALHCSTARAA